MVNMTNVGQPRPSLPPTEQPGGPHERREVFVNAHGNSSDPRETGSILSAARARLSQQPHLTTQRIWCDVCDGRLLLRGQVPSFYYKQLAQTAVAGLEGISQVVNDIEVVW